MLDESRLTGIPLFEGLEAPARRVLAAYAVLRRFTAGQTLWIAGGEPRGLFVVLEGKVRVIGGAGHRAHVLHSEGRGGTLGEVPLFSGGRYPATAEALEETLCMVLDRDAIALAIAADPSLAFRLLGALADRVRRLIDRLESNTGRSVRSRLANYLLARWATGADQSPVLAINQTELAEELGTVREVVVRELRWLRAAGLLTSAGRGRLKIADRVGLEREALTGSCVAS